MAMNHLLYQDVGKKSRYYGANVMVLIDFLVAAVQRERGLRNVPRAIVNVEFKAKNYARFKQFTDGSG